MNNIVNEDDFKYYMQDIERHYFGARYNYNELLGNEVVPFKFKSIITKYLKDEVPLDTTTLESHFYYMDKEGYDYKVYKQLKTRVRTSVYKNKDKKDKGFKEKLFTIEQLVKITPQEKEEQGMMIREVVISKLALFGFQL